MAKKKIIVKKKEAVLVPGKKAPSFRLRSQTGKLVSLNSLENEYTVVFFYPKDNTAGCTLEARGFTKYQKKLEQLGVGIVGISGGDHESKQKFCQKQGIKVTLLADPEFSISKKYKVFGEKKFMGRSYQGILRQTFILDQEKRILKIFEKVSPLTHPQEVVKFIEGVGE